jgi:SAM-dependent methyltransferase
MPLTDQLRHRIPSPLKARLAKGVPRAVLTRLVKTGGAPQWMRDVMFADHRRTFAALQPGTLDVAEISGEFWGDGEWRTHTNLDFPAFDLCAPPDDLPGPFDLVICEQVLEHVLDPVTAVRTLRRLCKQDGHVLVSTPFLVPLHGAPGDYWRFTPAGLARLLESQDLHPLWVRSWGNRQVIKANFDRWVSRFPWQSLQNEERLPVVVWSLAEPVAEQSQRSRESRF